MSAPPFKVTGFLAQTPRTTERLLPDMAAVSAENVNLTSGDIRPTKPPMLAYSPPDNSVPHYAAYRAVNGAGQKWRAWTKDIDIVKGPFAEDVEPRYYWTGDQCPRYTNYTLFGTTEYALGIPNPTAKPAAAAAGGVGSTINRIYCYTFYQPSTGEETGPAPVCDLASGKVDGTWTISNFSNTPANDRAVPYNTAGLKQRLYRTSGTAATFQMVGERDVSTGNWTDNLLDTQIPGDELISDGWAPPPLGLTGLIALPNGALVGFVGTLVCYSEPYQPHAWPVAYQFGTDFPVVGLSNYGTTVVAATAAYPYVLDGVEPASVTSQRVGNSWPCLSKRSIASVGDGVIFATTYGMAFVGASGPDMWTKNFYTVEEWEPLNPASMVSAVAEGRVFISYTPADSVSRILVFNVGEAATLTEYSLPSNELYADPVDGKLYLVGATVNRWNAATGDKLIYNWLSKEIELPEPVNYGAAKIDWVSTLTEADAAKIAQDYQAVLAANLLLLARYDTSGGYNMDAYNDLEINGSRLNRPNLGTDILTFTLYMNGREVLSRQIIESDAFRLPSGFKGDFLSFRLTGNVRVKSVKMAETMLGLKQV